VVLLSTHDEDQFDLSGSDATAYLAKTSFSTDRLSELWANAAQPGAVD